MSAASTGDNNVKAGVFVLISVAILVVVVFILGDLWNMFFGPASRAYRATWTVTEGVGHLQPGSTVRVGGISMGQVSSVTLRPSQDPARTIDVSFSLPDEVALYSNAIATIENGLISAESSISISSLGWDEAHRPIGTTGEPGTLLAQGDTLTGRDSGGILGALLGPGSGDSMRSMLSNVDEITSRLKRNGYVLEWILGDQPARSFSVGADSIGEVMQRMKDEGYVLDWVLGPESAQSTRVTLDEAEVLVARIRTDWEGADGHGGWSAEISKVLAQGDNLAEIVETVRTFVADNREKFQQIVDDTEASLASIRETSVPELNAMLTRGNDAVDDAAVVLADIRANAPLWTEDISDTLANLRIAGQQTSLLIQEARNAPWRLLYTPSEKQVSNELLYEASRNFVFGAADLKSAAASMDRLIEIRGDAVSESDRDFQVIRDNLMEAVRRYERAQEQLAQVLQGKTEPPAK